jgi:hypothetical protein
MKRRSEARMKERRHTSSAEDGRAREERRREGNEVEPPTDSTAVTGKRKGRDTEHMEGGREEGGHNAQEDGGRLGQGAGEVISLGKKALLLMFLQSVGQVVE